MQLSLEQLAQAARTQANAYAASQTHLTSDPSVRPHVELQVPRSYDALSRLLRQYKA